MPGVGGAQTEAPAQAPHTRMNIVPDSKLKHPDPMDDFAGLSFTDAQRSQIEEIRTKSRGRSPETG